MRSRGGCATATTGGRLAVGNCGGINTYTLTAKLGPARIDGSGPSERRRAAQPTWLESRARSQGGFGDQAGSWSVKIGIIVRPHMAIVTD